MRWMEERMDGGCLVSHVFTEDKFNQYLSFYCDCVRVPLQSFPPPIVSLAPVLSPCDGKRASLI